MGLLGKAAFTQLLPTSKEGIECTKAKQKLRPYCPKSILCVQQYLMPFSHLNKRPGCSLLIFHSGHFSTVASATHVDSKDALWTCKPKKGQ